MLDHGAGGMAARRGGPRDPHTDEPEYDYPQWSSSDYARSSSGYPRSSSDYPQWSADDYPPDAGSDEDDSSSGRHRARRTGPLLIAAAITVVLVVFGIGAIVLSPVLDGGSAAGPSGPLAPAASGPEPGESLPIDPSAAESASAQPSQTAASRLEDAIVALVNSERAKAGCRPVRVDPQLRTAARRHSTDMAAHTRLDHQGSDGSSPADRARAAGYNGFLGENIAAGQRSPQQIMAGWMGSREQRSTILNCRAKALGVGVAYARDGTPYWTQDFGRN
jgi:uncharacterized protein YkwD